MGTKPVVLVSIWENMTGRRNGIKDVRKKNKITSYLEKTMSVSDNSNVKDLKQQGWIHGYSSRMLVGRGIEE